MAIPKGHRKNLATLIQAAKNDSLALMECVDAKTREPRYVICAVEFDGKEYEFKPFGHMFEGNSPYEQYLPPA